MALYDWAICTYDEFVDALTDQTVPDSERLLIERVINAVTDFVETYCGRRIKRRSDAVTEYPWSYGCKWIQLAHPPVSVQEVYEDPDGEFGTDTLLDSDDYVVDEETGLIVKRKGKFPEGFKVVKVVYYGGFESVPEDLKDVGIQLAIDIYRRYKNRQVSVESLSKRGVSAAFSPRPNAWQREVLDSYRIWRVG